MDFYYRVFAAVEKKIWLEEVEAFLEETGSPLTVVGAVDEEDEDDLDAEPTTLAFFNDKDEMVATLEYDSVAEPDSVAAADVAEFQALVDEMAPERNREWTREKLGASTGCFAFNILEPGFEEENWDNIAEIAAWLRDETNGIEESDGGQITNEAGDVVLVVPDDDDSDDEEDEEDKEAGETEKNGGDDAEDADWTGRPVAIRVGDRWVAKEIESEEAFRAFMNGEI